MDDCPVRKECIRLHIEAGEFKSGGKRKYVCGFILAGTVKGCPRRKRLSGERRQDI